METRYCFVKDHEDHWYIIDTDRKPTFNALLNTDPILLADEFDGERIFEPIEDYSFEFPYKDINDEYDD